MRLFILIILIWCNSCPADEKNIISNFSQKILSGWNEKELEGKTHYQLVKQDGKYVLSAQSIKAASGLYKEIHVNLNKTPYLNWSWYAASRLDSINEESKNGDDYVARLYIIKKHSFFFWKTKALNYVWSSNQKKHSQWNNAYTSKSKMFAIRGKESQIKQWHNEKRNVKEDFKRFFDEDIDNIEVIAIMSDTDNSKLSAHAFYGDIFFSSD